MGMSTHGGERRVCPTALQPPPHLLTTLPVPAGSGRCGSHGVAATAAGRAAARNPVPHAGDLGERPGLGAERAWAGSRRTAQARGRAGDGVVDELRPARAATTYRPRAWDGQRASRPSSPPSGAEVVPAGTADRGRRAERRRSRFPTSGAARESTTSSLLFAGRRAPESPRGGARAARAWSAAGWFRANEPHAVTVPPIKGSP